jgi:dTDP-4-amino-4,6-dideoxygalactose transaminase
LRDGAADGDRPLGGIDQVGALSFHETKNVTCGEGGALIVNRPEWVEKAEILQEKGTNRSQFFRGQVDKYTWVDLGSSFLTSEINAAFLWAQLEQADVITARRLEVWDAYHEGFAALEEQGLLRRPIVPDNCVHNAHMYYLLLNDADTRDTLIEDLGREHIQAVFHYIPLHSSPAGQLYGRAHGDMAVTDHIRECLVRLPLWVGMQEEDVARVVHAVEKSLT